MVYISIKGDYMPSGYCLKPAPKRGYPYTQEEDKILINNYKLMSSPKISELYLPHRSHASINTRLKQLGYQISKDKYIHGDRCSKYTINHKSFNEYTLKSCYWAGFIAADGCISKNTVIVSLDELDLSHLQLLREFLNSTHLITPPRISRKDKCHRFVFRSPYIIADLGKYFNVKQKKTFTLQPPPIQEWEYKLAYLIGFIDGDGCIYTTHFTKPYVFDKMTFSIFANYNMLNWMIDIFKEINPNINNKSDHLYRHTKTHAAFQASSYQMTNILKVLNNIDVPKLARKWDNVTNFDNNKRK